MGKVKKIGFWISTLIVLIIGIVSWAIYNLIYKLIGDLLAILKISNTYLQNIIVILAGVGVLLLLGFSLKKVINKVIF